MASYFDHFIVVKLVNLYFTDSLLVFILVMVGYFIIFSKFNLIPERFQNFFEIVINHWEEVIEENLGKDSEFYIFPILFLFLFLLGINFLGFFLFIFPSSTHLSLTFGLSISVWLGVIFLGFKKFKSSFFSVFMPLGAPIYLSFFLVFIELISNVSRPISLGMRLAANLTAGHILLSILSDFGIKMLLFSFSFINLFPILIIIFMTVLEIGVLVIQAYVFCLLCVIYLKDSLILH